MDTFADVLNFIASNPITSAVLAAVGPGLYAIWRAVVSAAVRRIDAAFADPGVHSLPPEAQREHVTNSVARSMPVPLPRGVIAAEVKKKQSERPPSN